MVAKKIRQILTVVLIVLFIIGAVLYWKSMEEHRYDLLDYLGKTKEEVEQGQKISLVPMRINGIEIHMSPQKQERIFFVNDSMVEGMMFWEQGSNYCVDQMKIGDSIERHQQRLKQQYEYRPLMLNGIKMDLYENIEGNYIVCIGWNADTGSIQTLFLCKKEYEDRFFKDISTIQDAWEYDGFVLPESDTKKIPQKQLEELSERELILAYSEIYARHGYVFEDESIQQVFNRTSWYVADEACTLETLQLNEYEKSNSKAIQEELEKKKDNEIKNEKSNSN